MDTRFLWVGILLAGFALAMFARDDWRLVSSRRVRTRGIVYAHRRSLDDGSESFAAQIRFQTDDGRAIEIVDGVLHPTPTPPVGSEVDLVYPAARPTLARRPRPALRIVIYSVLIFVLVVLFARV